MKKCKVIKGKFAGFCDHCEMILADIDLKDLGYKCPTCNRYSKKPKLKRHDQI